MPWPSSSRATRHDPRSPAHAHGPEHHRPPGTLQPLADPALFAQARLDARGGYVIWTDDELELAADNLRHLATEQAGGIGHECLWHWLRVAITIRQGMSGFALRTSSGICVAASPISSRLRTVAS